MMYNPQLDTFICVVEAGSFSKAADTVYFPTGGDQADQFVGK